MAKRQVPPLERQLARVSRRLFLRSFLSSLFWCWAAGLLLAGTWFIAQSLALDGISPQVRLSVAAGILLAATITAGVWAVYRAPARLAAALLLDEAFGLRERVTTSYLLAPEQVASPAACALLADVNERLAKLDVGSKIGVRISWWAGVAPAVAGVLALAAFFYQPTPTQATSGSQDKKAEVIPNAKEIEKKLDQLKKKNPERRPEGRPMSEELKRIDQELEQIANRPRTTKEQLKDRIKEMTALEDQLKAREKEMADRSRSLKQQLQQMDKMGNKQASQEGPGRDLQKALSQGKFEKAREELERLTKKLKANSLTPKEKQQLAKQLKDAKEKLERLAQQKDKADQLNRLHREGKLSSEALKKEMERLKEDAKKLQDMQALASQLAEAQKSLEENKDGSAAESLSAAASQLKEMDLRDKDLADLRDQLERLQDAKDSC
jgi:septal ring factor EnvC (AmiA/AmiB activator)